jgi:hypothetical protein
MPTNVPTVHIASTILMLVLAMVFVGKSMPKVSVFGILCDAEQGG